MMDNAHLNLNILYIHIYIFTKEMVFLFLRLESSGKKVRWTAARTRIESRT